MEPGEPPSLSDVEWNLVPDEYVFVTFRVQPTQLAASA
tara:strand:+ start:104 stop:217 length:114 start_codon:yes stop_codon:yes gene_type:complete